MCISQAACTESGNDVDRGGLCTSAYCFGSLEVEFSPPIEQDYVVVVTAPDRSDATILCDLEQPIFDEQVFGAYGMVECGPGKLSFQFPADMFLDPDVEFHVSIATHEGGKWIWQWGSTVTRVVDSNSPNGVECGPTCVQREGRLQLERGSEP
jgi:hypothetical protein